jgi:predicted lipid-binding transport protein (Tim44 family)
MNNLIEFFLVGAVIYYGIRALIRFLLPMLFQSLVNKAQQGGNQQQQYRQSANRRQAEGSVRVDKAPKTKSSIPDSEGDYIDYEEIK